MAQMESAPVYTVPGKEIVAVEHPMIIKNIDNGLKTFGRGTAPLAQLLNTTDYDGCLPLYLRPRDPTCAPNLSHNAPTNNILLKITIPKRTGRKRKRGTDGPFEWHEEDVDAAIEREGTTHHEGQTPGLMSHSRYDDPKDLQRRLRECKDTYQIEPVGCVDQTHRYRGLSDFHYSTSHQPFMNKFKNTIMTGQLEHLKEFKLDPAMGVKQNTELIPPPILTDHTIPFNWGYHQNPTIKIAINPLTGQKTVYNHSTPAKLGTLYVSHDIPEAPTQPLAPPPQDPVLLSLIKELEAALSERPIWTRRAITNRVSASPGIYLLKPAIQYVGYQFRGGPWRDAIIKYGIDPRKDPKYRFYQTLFFKIYDEQEKVPGQPWLDIRSEYTRRAQITDTALDTHIFDGRTLSLDGKVWQVCDITDPLIRQLASTKTLREVCDNEVDGWYCNGTWAKIKTVMRAKITAIRAGKEVPESAFKTTLQVPDEVEVRVKGKLNVPQPDLRRWGVDDNPGREGVKRRRIRLAARRWKKDGKKVPGLAAVEEDEEDEEEEGGDADDGEEEETALPKSLGGNYEPPKLRARPSRKAKEKAVATQPNLGDEDVEGEEGDAGADDDERYFARHAANADDDEVSEWEGDD